MTAKLALILYSFMMLGFGNEIRHCRKAAQGCENRMKMFAGWMCDAGSQFRVDPFLLASIAYVESGLDPFRVGKIGELSIMQIHPRSAWGSPKMENSCRSATGACQKPFIFKGAEILKSGICLLYTSPSPRDV